MDESQIENNCFKLLEVVLQGTESWGLLVFFFGFFTGLDGVLRKIFRFQMTVHVFDILCMRN